MVVIWRPSTALNGTEHERIAVPATWTVQAPHWAMPQPYLVPVSPIVSRSTQRSGVSGSTSTWWVLPLTVRSAIGEPPCIAPWGRWLIPRSTLGHAAPRVPERIAWFNSNMEIAIARGGVARSEEHTSELQSHSDLVCRLLLEKKKV